MVSLDGEQIGPLLEALAAAGCVSPLEEAAELLDAARSGGKDVDVLLTRRVAGEPLAWIVGAAPFCGLRILVSPGVFVPRPHSEPLALRARELVPDRGAVVDVCTGSGAIAAFLASERPDAKVVATDVDPLAVACAVANGVDARLGDLFDPVPVGWRGGVDVITAVVPYVPTEELHLLPRDVRANEPSLALDGGRGGTEILARVVSQAGTWLRTGGTLLLEIGGDQRSEVSAMATAAGLTGMTVHRDADGRDVLFEARRAD
jgi:release factor glutamine methyltransferase